MNSDSGPEAPRIEFETLTEAIRYVFGQKQTSRLSHAEIWDGLKGPNLWINLNRQGFIPTTQIQRRQISDALCRSAVFRSVGPPGSHQWSVLPFCQQFGSENDLVSAIQSNLAAAGPRTFDELVGDFGLSGDDVGILRNVFTAHRVHFTCGSGDRYWFTNQPEPKGNDFPTMVDALVTSLRVFPGGAWIEELSWFLCLSNVNGSEKVTRRRIAKELSRHSEIFERITQGKYKIADQWGNAPNSGDPGNADRDGDAEMDHNGTDTWSLTTDFFSNGDFMMPFLY
jgi:hypothetical protein